MGMAEAAESTLVTAGCEGTAYARPECSPCSRSPPHGKMRPSAAQLSAGLCEALRGEETEMVEALLKLGANPNLVLPEGIAAIHLAAGMEQESGVRCLGIILQYGGDPNVRSVDGLTPLHVAASWGCYTCLKLLLIEGGDPSLADQEGNRAIDLAMEQGNEMCVHILQQILGESRPEQSPWMSHRGAGSFFSIDTEDFSEIGSWLSEDATLPGRCNISQKLLPKESLEDVGPGGSIHNLASAALNKHLMNCIPADQAYCFGACLASKLLTGDSQRHGTLASHSNPCAQAVTSPNVFFSCSDVLENLGPVQVPNDKSVCPKAEVHVGMSQVLCSESTIDGGRQVCLDPAAFQDGISLDCSVGSQSGSPKLSPEVLSCRGSWEARKGSPTCAVQGECEIGILEMQDANATLNLSQYESFLDPDLVKITGQEGLDVTSPDHAYVVCRLNSTGTSDLENTVVDLAFLARARGKQDGCSGEEKSFTGSSDGGGSSQYISYNSECYASSLAMPCYSKAQKHKERTVGLASSLCSSNSIQSDGLLQIFQGPCPGASKDCLGEHIETRSVSAVGEDRASHTRYDSVRHLHDGSCCKQAFSSRCAGMQSSDFHNTGESKCLGNIRKPGLSQMSQGELPVKGPVENWDFCTLPFRELHHLTVSDDPGEEDTAPLEALASVIRKQDPSAKLQEGLNGSPFAEARTALNEDPRKSFISDLSWSNQEMVERGGDSWAGDTILIQKESEEMQVLPVSKSSITSVDDTAAILLHTLNIEESSDLDTKLKRRMVATKVCHSPLLQGDQRPCHVTPRSKSRTAASVAHASSSSSLFDEPLEKPRRSRRVRSPDGMLLTASEVRKPDTGLMSRSPPCRLKEDTSRLEDTQLMAASPECCQQASRPQSSASGSITASPKKVCTNHNRSSREVDVKNGIGDSASLEVKPPLMESTWLPKEGEGECTAHIGADAVSSSTEPEKSVNKTSSAKTLPSPSRISFSRFSSRGPSGMPGCYSHLPERLSPSSSSCKQDVPLSLEGRPVNVSTSEPVEYLYIDEDEGHTLIERHIPSTDHSVANTTSSEDTIIYDWRAYMKGQMPGQSDKENCHPQLLSKLGHPSDEALVRKLRDFGVNPGPVTGLTRKVYMQLLEKLMSDPKSKSRKSSTGYSLELSSALETYQIPDGKDDEMTLFRQFDQPDKNQKWREGVLKSSFNYLLLDPRVTQNLPFRSQFISQAECFRTFISAVFYVGKGKRSRPYCHLYEALTHYKESRRKQGGKVCPKVQHILEIWASGEGVISMHCFQNVIPVEAYTREASMVDAIGLKMLTNQKRGNYYGVVAGWSMKRRRGLGIHLLHRAMQIFLAEGERQLRPTDIRIGQ